MVGISNEEGEFVERLTNEVMFYGGLAIVAVAALAAIALTFVLIINRMRLNAKFTAEYGEKRNGK
jgi:hypothetical protein